MDPSREAYWRGKLRSIRLGAEPVEVQLRRRFLAMIVISGLTAMIGLILLAILGAFGRVDIGLRMFGLVFLPATSWFWLDYALLRRRASAYLREQAGVPNDPTAEGDRPITTSPPP